MDIKELFDGKGNKHNLDSEKIGDLQQLGTDAKENIVAAVNELNDKLPDVGDNEALFVHVVDGVLKTQTMLDVSKEGV